MSNDALLLTLTGEVTLSLFTKALKHFDGLIKSLTEEVLGPAEKVEWEIFQLESGSARMGVKPVQGSSVRAHEVVSAYITIGKALEKKNPIPYSDEVERHAIALTNILNGHLTAITLETQEAAVSITDPVYERPHKRLTPGSVSGLVNGIERTRTDNPRFRLSLINPLYQRYIYCYLSLKQEKEARAAWLQRVSISGMVYTHPETGRPIQVTDIQRIDILPTPEPYSYKIALGALPWHEGDELPEVAIRRVRDAV